jgi:ankyrin repeat protein
VGWHAKSFGFDWNKRADQHKYLVKNGLPEVHAAIVNDDWDLALELICPDDFGLHWMPSTSERTPQKGNTGSDSSSWSVKLLSQNEVIRKLSILDMAAHTFDATSIDKNSLYGANLLNLCLLKPARPDVLQHVITLAAKHAPQYLNLPDALGRTPLWVAIDNQDQASIQLLLKAGADPLQACKFSDEGEPKSPLSLAAKYDNKEVFRDLLRAVVEQGKKSISYAFNKDPLFLKYWASNHSSEDVQWLADQVEAIREPLFCCEDISGTSYFYRADLDGSVDNKLSSEYENFESFVVRTVNTTMPGLEKVSVDGYERWLKSVSLSLKDETKIMLFVHAASRSNDHMDLVFGMFDCSLEINTSEIEEIEEIEIILYRAANFTNTRVFEFAADRSFQMGEVLESLRAGNDVGHGMFFWALKAGSLKWVEKLIGAGLDRQSAIANHPTYICMLADLDPQGVAEKLNGLNYVITPLVVQHASTEAGKQALMALMANPNNAN